MAIICSVCPLSFVLAKAGTHVRAVFSCQRFGNLGIVSLGSLSFRLEELQLARLALFIDGGYIDKLCEKEFDRARVNFDAFQRALTQIVADSTSEPLDLLRTLFYHCPPYQGNPPSEDERRRTAGFRRFADALKGIDNFDFREGRLALRGFDRDTGRPIFQQKRVDLMLGLDFALMSAKQGVTHIGLVAGDSDLIPAVEVAKGEGVNTWLFHGPRITRDGRSTYSQDLWQQVDKRHEIDQALIDSVKR